MNRDHQTRREWTALIEKYETSGERQSTFVAKSGVGLSAFRGWLYRIRRDRRGTKGTSLCAIPSPNLRLLPVEIASRGRAFEVEIELQGRGILLRVPSDAEPRIVASLVAALRGGGSC